MSETTVLGSDCLKNIKQTLASPTGKSHAALRQDHEEIQSHWYEGPQSFCSSVQIKPFCSLQTAPQHSCSILLILCLWRNTGAGSVPQASEVSPKLATHGTHVPGVTATQRLEHRPSSAKTQQQRARTPTFAASCDKVQPLFLHAQLREIALLR